MAETTAAAGAPPTWKARLFQAGGFACVTAAVLAGMASETVLLAEFAVLAAVLALPFLPAAALAFYAAVLGMREPVNYMPLKLAGVSVYAGDLVLALFLGAVLYVFLDNISGRRTGLPLEGRAEKLLAVILAASLAWGLLSAATGLARGWEARDVLGDYRRLYAYMLGFLAALWLCPKDRHLRMLKWVFFAGAAGAVLFGLYRMGTGRYFHSTAEHAEYPRLLADDEIVSLSLALSYAAAVAVFERGAARRAAALGLGALCMAFMLMSGWRMGFLHALMAPAFALWFMSRMRRVSLGRLAARAVVAVMLVCAVMGGVLLVFSGTTRLIWTRMDERMYHFGVPFLDDVDYRPYAYKTALLHFAEHPVLGMGIGHQMTFAKKTSEGVFEYYSHTTHNIFLDTLYQTGLPGLLLFAGFLWVVARRAHKSFARLPDEWHALMAAALSGLFCALIHQTYEISAVSGMVSLYLLCGFIMLICRRAAPPAETAPDGDGA